MASVVQYTYDPEDIILLIGGVPIESWGSDTAVTLSANNDRVEVQEGITGEITVNKSRMLSGTITVNVKAQSVEDKMFDELGTMEGLYGIPIALYIGSANKQLVTDGWYQGMADLEAGTSISDRAHVFGVSNSQPSLIDSAQSIVSQVQGIKL
ncbi:conserved hypothetical protein [Vibrio phage 249E41-1]|nr:conserved hypothetical protein [Vibrio phage 249E41-1]CAH9012699.1 conserved hypothetical protein [Vibrio phage 495E54-1]CAH9012862.1 conserved hypothetical protein [Vibrio phage 496E54-1]CAH9016647.1 conserved hypothetical protein [Vibrio phage 193E37-1]